MITVTNRDTCKAAYVDEKCVLHIEELQEEVGGKPYPFSRIFIRDEKQKHEYFLDVVESKRKIESLIDEKTSEQS